MAVKQNEPVDRGAARMARRRQLQEIALRLFRTAGYDAVTSQQIAAAAGVTERTFFRYFPTKDSVVLWYVDDEEPDVVPGVEIGPGWTARALAERRARWIIRGEADRRLLLDRTQLITSTSFLRALWLEKNYRQALRLVSTYAERGGTDDLATRVEVVSVFAAACAVAEVWAAEGGGRALDDLLDDAFATLDPSRGSVDRATAR